VGPGPDHIAGSRTVFFELDGHYPALVRQRKPGSKQLARSLPATAEPNSQTLVFTRMERRPLTSERGGSDHSLHRRSPRSTPFELVELANQGDRARWIAHTYEVGGRRAPLLDGPWRMPDTRFWTV